MAAFASCFSDSSRWRTASSRCRSTAAVASLILSPVGEFSFVIAGAGLAMGALSPDGYKLALAVIAMSLLVSPLFFLFARVCHRKATTGHFRRRVQLAPALPGPG